jgi:hypothetical protein
MSTTTKDNVRKPCAKALKTHACDVNAQDCTLQNVTVARDFSSHELCTEHNRHFAQTFQ